MSRGLENTRRGVLLFVTGVARREIFLFRSQVDSGTSERSDSIDVLEVRNRLAITEGAGRLHLLD